MKKSIILLSLMCFLGITTYAQNFENEVPVEKGDYKLLKLDALNLMGLGVQKLHLAFEVSPMKANSNNLPTVNFNLIVPFNSLNEIEMNYGLEGGAELRFYQKRRNRKTPIAEGFFLGVGLDGGYTNFNRLDQYYVINGSSNREVNNEYDRVRTGIYFLMGAQSKLGEKLYFDINFGMGWSNVNVQQTSEPLDATVFIKDTSFNGPFYLLYREGKGQRFYIPVSFGLGYNFGNR